MNPTYNHIAQRKSQGLKSFAVLMDPDKLTPKLCREIAERTSEFPIHYFFVGGSLLTSDQLAQTIRSIKENCDVPVIIFPGSNMQIDRQADAILFLSLISGRNADALIGQHVVAAPILKQSGLEVISTGYILIDGGRPTTVSYISNTTPIPADKPGIAACTAMAGEMLGLKLIYMDSGSGAMHPVSPEMIGAVRQSVSCPIVVGGGITTVEKAREALDAGADVIVIGNGIEKNPHLMAEVSQLVQEYNLLKSL